MTKKTKSKHEEKLSKNQVKFIKNKVRKLGSVEAVEESYRLGDPVGKFASEYAKEVFSNG
ncbi:hypothetical protein LCGC14_1942280 [marine sediment metagenome]|uniref:Uncharacterized protein n=1 Tax=marine sediment metagenome TaxID=412755 RepID=A0A0F9HYA0_9ZZZZ